MIPLHKPYLTGNEITYMQEVLQSLRWSGNGTYTRRCSDFLRTRYRWSDLLLTTSCSDALEMACLLTDWPAGSEVIIPSFHFVSAANAVVLRGGVPVFADSSPSHPNIDIHQLEALITPRTRAILPVHYAGVACDMDALTHLATKYNLILIEDAALALEATYKQKPLGSFGAFSAFSFHDTKTVSCGEGGLLVINDPGYARRAEVIWEKGTNRSAFIRGEVDKYGWVDVGGSFLPADILAAFLYAQLEQLEEIHRRRLAQWNLYYDGLSVLEKAGKVRLPYIPDYAGHNGQIFYLLCDGLDERTSLQAFLQTKGVHSSFHYQALHSSPYFASRHDGRPLPHAERYSHTLLRLPLYHTLTTSEQEEVIGHICSFYGE